jgi:hypothetical protein
LSSAIIFERTSGEMPRFTVSTISLSLGSRAEVSSGGCSINDVTLFANASAISAELIPKESSPGYIEGVIEKTWQLHLKALFSSTSLAVEAGMYLKNLVRSWIRFGERGIWLPRNSYVKRCVIAIAGPDYEAIHGPFVE